MSDIHKLGFTGNSDGKGKLQVVYHVPNDKLQNQHPGISNSIVDGISAQELASLQDGSLVEKVDYIPVNTNRPEKNVDDRLKIAWQECSSSSQSELNRKYQYYGKDLAGTN
jgi:hypothetical protein